MSETSNPIFNQSNRHVSSARLYSQLSSDEDIAAQEKWRQYLRVVRHVFEYLADDHPEILTELERRVMLRKRRQSKN